MQQGLNGKTMKAYKDYKQFGRYGGKEAGLTWGYVNKKFVGGFVATLCILGEKEAYKYNNKDQPYVHECCAIFISI